MGGVEIFLHDCSSASGLETVSPVVIIALPLLFLLLFFPSAPFPSSRLAAPLATHPLSVFLLLFFPPFSFFFFYFSLPLTFYLLSLLSFLSFLFSFIRLSSALFLPLARSGRLIKGRELARETRLHSAVDFSLLLFLRERAGERVDFSMTLPTGSSRLISDSLRIHSIAFFFVTCLNSYRVFL